VSASRAFRGQIVRNLLHVADDLADAA